MTCINIIAYVSTMLYDIVRLVISVIVFTVTKSGVTDGCGVTIHIH